MPRKSPPVSLQYIKAFIYNQSVVKDIHINMFWNIWFI